MDPYFEYDEIPIEDFMEVSRKIRIEQRMDDYIDHIVNTYVTCFNQTVMYYLKAKAFTRTDELAYIRAFELGVLEQGYLSYYTPNDVIIKNRNNVLELLKIGVGISKDDASTILSIEHQDALEVERVRQNNNNTPTKERMVSNVIVSDSMRFLGSVAEHFYDVRWQTHMESIITSTIRLCVFEELRSNLDSNFVHKMIEFDPMLRTMEGVVVLDAVNKGLGNFHEFVFSLPPYTPYQQHMEYYRDHSHSTKGV